MVNWSNVLPFFVSYVLKSGKAESEKKKYSEMLYKNFFKQVQDLNRGQIFTLQRDKAEFREKARALGKLGKVHPAP